MYHKINHKHHSLSDILQYLLTVLKKEESGKRCGLNPDSLAKLLGSGDGWSLSQLQSEISDVEFWIHSIFKGKPLVVTCISGFGSCFGFGFCLVFVILFHTKDNKLFLLSITCVETSEWSEEQNRDCYPLYKSHLDAGSELKIKMSMTLALFFLPCPTVQQEGRYQALV